VGCPDFLQWILGLYSASAPGMAQQQPDLELFAGTSQATPHVSGLVALMVSKAIADGLTLTPQSARTIIKKDAANISDPHQGKGRIDALKTLNDTGI
jgi:subtilisin family serine protease